MEGNSEELEACPEWYALEQRQREKVKFWTGNWLNGAGCLLNHKQGSISEEDYNLKVSDGCWD